MELLEESGICGSRGAGAAATAVWSVPHCGIHRIGLPTPAVPRSCRPEPSAFITARLPVLHPPPEPPASVTRRKRPSGDQLGSTAPSIRIVGEPSVLTR